MTLQVRNLAHSSMLGLAVFVTLALGGCERESEDRPLMYEQGTYQGEQDRKLTPDEVRALQLRGERQKF